MIYFHCKSIILSTAEWRNDGRGPRGGRQPGTVIKSDLTVARADGEVRSRGGKKHWDLIYVSNM